MKYKIISETDDRVQFSCVHGSFFNTVDILKTEQTLKDMYILSSVLPKQKIPKEIDLSEYQDYDESPIPTQIEILDTDSLTGRILDQHGGIMDGEIQWSVEGTGAKIENGTLVKEEVTEPTSFFIVAKHGDLEDKREVFLDPPPTPDIEEPKATVEELRALEKELTMANAKIEVLSQETEFQNDLIQEMALMIYGETN